MTFKVISRARRFAFGRLSRAAETQFYLPTKLRKFVPVRVASWPARSCREKLSGTIVLDIRRRIAIISYARNR